MDNPPGDWNNGLDHAALTDVGLRRSNNQDSYAVALAGSHHDWIERGHLLTLADGMGAHAAGELASKMATDNIPLTYFKMRHEAPAVALKVAVETANQMIHARGTANPDFKGMGTTSVTMLLLPEGALVGHVGDSRAYRLRGDLLEQLTFDHSLVWEMRASGTFGAAGVPSFIPKNMITRSLGPNDKVDVDIEGPFPMAVGDTFLLCSDGLSGQVEDEEIGIIIGCLPAEEAVKVLVDLANLRGGPDNTTVIMARITDPTLTETPAPVLPLSTHELRKQVPHSWWGALGILGFATLIFALLNVMLLALICGVLTLGLAILVALRRFVPGQRSFARQDQLRLGKGPHASQKAIPNQAFLEKLARTASQLREAASGENWVVDWHHFNQLVTKAENAGLKGDFRTGVTEYCRAITFMMKELRSQQKKRSNETTTAIDLEDM